MKNNDSVLNLIDVIVNNGGILPHNGLCDCLDYEVGEFFNKVFHPTDEEIDELYENDMSTLFWGSGLEYDDPDRWTEFTPLRQTLLAFLLVINEEDFI